jgi:DNA-binding transcriptional LysR family regulator
LRAFDAVGQNSSFTLAAVALSVSQSAISRHVIGLEELLGKPLFLREASKLTLTPEGEALLPIVSKSFDRIEQTMNAIRDDSVTRPPLRLQIPPSLLQQLFMPMLRDFRSEHSEVSIDVSSAHVTGLPSTHFDMAIVYDRPNVDDRITDLLWMVRVSPLCSPQTAQAADGKSLDAFLAGQELLHLKLEGEPRDLLWSSYLRRGGINVPTSGGLAFDTAVASAQYAMSASGVFLGDVDMFAEEIEAGRLVKPYDLTVEDGYGYYLKLHADDLSDPDIAMFRRGLINRFSAFPRKAKPDTA